VIDDRTIEKNTGLTAEAIRLAATWDSIDDPTIRLTILEFIEAAAKASALCRPAIKAFRVVDGGQ
jgi:hypothetical protein